MMTEEERKAEARKQFNNMRTNKLLFIEQDGMGLADRPFDEELTTYRQALRDLPLTSDIDLNSDGELIGVDWPKTPLRYFYEMEGATKE